MGSNTPISLVKFLSAPDGYATLKDELIRWAVPSSFSDPFEITFHSAPNFDEACFTQAAIKEIIAMLFGCKDPSGYLTPIKKAVKRWRMEQRFRSDEEAKDALIHLLPAMVKKHFEEVEELKNKWRLYAYNVRILSLSDNYRDLSLWEAHADAHRGVAIRFKVGTDHSFQKPLKVLYRSTRAQVLSLNDEIDLFMGSSNSERDTSLESKFLIKSKHLATQKEWRCITRAHKLLSPGNTNAEPEHEMRPFTADEVMAVYFGVSVSQQDKLKYIDLLEESYPQVKLYQAQLGEKGYELDFIQSDLEGFRESIV